MNEQEMERSARRNSSPVPIPTATGALMQTRFRWATIFLIVVLIVINYIDRSAVCTRCSRCSRNSGSLTGCADPLDPDGFLRYLEGEIARLSSDGGFATIVLHLSLLEWLDEDRLGALLDRLAESSHDGHLWLAPCADVAERVLADPSEFLGKAKLDATSWAG